MIVNNIHGLSCEFLENGNIKSIQADPIRISLKASLPFDESGANLYLRKRGNPIKFTALLGPENNSLVQATENTLEARGNWSGLEHNCSLHLSRNDLSWRWVITIKNLTQQLVELDIVWKQDVGLKPVGAGLVNEYYVSQYLERSILEDEQYGSVICCRQNMRESTGHPWLMLVCLNGAASGSTDGMQFYGKSYRETGIPEGLLGERLGGEYAGESSVVALQGKPFKLMPGESRQVTFTGIYQPDHPKATSREDLALLKNLVAGTPSQLPGTPSQSLGTPSRLGGTPSRFLPVEDLNDDDLTRFFGKERRHPETEKGKLLSFFTHDNHHVVLKAKELLADRPHGHILQAKSGLKPDESIMSTTSFMTGVFNSHLTQGNTNFNVLLSICTCQFNQDRHSGQRLILTIDNQQYLLGMPSAFEMGLNHCRWIYKHGEHCFQVRTWTSKIAPQVNLDFKVLSGDPVNLAITHDFDPMNGWKIMPGSVICESVAIPATGSMIRDKFPDARFRIVVQDKTADFEMESLGNEMESLPNEMESLFLIKVNQTSAFSMSFLGEVVAKTDPVKFADADLQFASDCKVAQTEWKDLSLNLYLTGKQPDIAAIREILPWYGMNALTYFLTPYGLEQFGGAAWGTRDVSQGPVDLLLALEKYDEARQVLCIIFSNQNPDGGWPQWWMFDSYFNIRAHEAHGDIFYWCILALSKYIKVTGDHAILEETLPYYHDKGHDFAEKTPLGEHVERLIKMITGSFIPGTSLVPYGGGDWNDSLQPVSQTLASRMISSWTVEMCYQAFSEYQQVYLLTNQSEKAAILTEVCRNIQADFNKHLVREGVVAGYGLVEDDGTINVLLHPQDGKTGIKYSLLPMERGINSGMFNKEQADHHLKLIEAHLKGPDGARLMDRPLKYKGGIQEIFQRAESSTFFGREIGLMYVHEHIRYAEALARMGKAEEFVKALRQAIPVGYRDIVPNGDIRQANCYYSSSDVHFKNRYEADERYAEVIAGKFPLRGGWRVYSSGPGIYLSLVITRLLGLRVEKDKIILDPVMPHSFDGLSVYLYILDNPVTLKYSVKEGNFSPKTILVNGKTVPFSYEENNYRKGGAVLEKADFLVLLDAAENFIEILM